MGIKEVYSTKELLELLGYKKASAVIRRAEREVWASQKLQASGGGYLWVFSSMPEATQLEIRTAEARLAIEQESALVVTDSSAVAPQKKTPVLTEKKRKRALDKADLVAQYLNWQKRFGNTVAQKDAFISAYQSGIWPHLLSVFGTKVSWKSLERWKNQLKGDGITALADKRGIAHKGRTILTEQHQLIILGQVLNPNAPAIGEVLPRIHNRFQHEGLQGVSDATIRRFVNRYEAQCFDEFTLWRHGKKAWNDHCAISILRDWNLVEVGDIVIADGHTLNFETLNPETGKATRMTLVLFYDGASNCPLGWDVMATENIASISSAFRHTCMILGKYPKIIYLDNGKAFRAKFFKGTPDFEQAGFLGLYRELGCEVIHAWPYHGQSKTIERFFNTFHELEVAIPSYTGNCIDAKPPRMMRGEKLHRDLYENMGGRPLTLLETIAVIGEWFRQYAGRPQFRTHLNGKSPAELLYEGRGPGVDVRRLDELMLQKTIRTVTKDGIRHEGRLYWNEALRGRRHEVVIRYDNLAPYSVFVYTLDGDPICEALDRHHHQIAAGVHPAAGILGDEGQRKLLSDSLAIKNNQWSQASADMKHLTNVVLAGAQERQKSIESLKDYAFDAPKALPEIKLTKEEITEFEAGMAKAKAKKEAAARGPAYMPSFEKRFKDELARYDYLFKVKHEDGISLVSQDKDWMKYFEGTENYKRNCAKRYEQLREFFEHRACAL